jgi:hypothetical protein
LISRAFVASGEVVKEVTYGVYVETIKRPFLRLLKAKDISDGCVEHVS